MSNKKIHLLIIDPQNSFAKVVDPSDQQDFHNGELCVPGAWEDMVRVADMIDRIGDKIDDITVTLDSHHRLHIAHPMWWKDANGDRPQPFTSMREENGIIIGSQYDANGTPHDVGEFQTSRPAFHKHTIDYLRTLQTRGRYPHMVWPEHCLIGTPGHLIVEPLQKALFGWEDNIALVNKVTKGSNMHTEHFSAVKAEVEDSKDPSTQINADLISNLNEADEVLLSGEALSHCVANTVRDIADQFADDSFVKKIVLLEDATSSVTGFEGLGDAFVNDMKARGMKVSTTVDYLSI